MVKIFSKYGNVRVVLGHDELWTTDMKNGARFSVDEAKAIVDSFKAMNPKRSYWYKK